MAVQLIDGSLVFTYDNGVMAPVVAQHRQIMPTPPLSGRIVHLNQFSNVMLDARAVGLWNGVINGPGSKMLHLAELIVQYGLEQQIAEIFLAGDLVGKINAHLITRNQRFKSGVWSLDYATLYEAVSKALGAMPVQTDPKNIAARLITGILAKAFGDYNIFVPFVGVLELEHHGRLIANLDDLIVAAQVMNVTEILEQIATYVKMESPKELMAHLTEARFSEQLATAGNRLMNALHTKKQMHDAAVLTAKFIVKAHDIPDDLRESPDLAYLATNMSFTLGALKLLNQPIQVQAHKYEAAITYTVMRLRELKRFVTVPLETFKQMYRHRVVTDAKGRLTGVFVARNEDVTMRAQVTRLLPRDNGAFYMQAPVEVAEAYVSPLMAAVGDAWNADRMVDYVDLAFTNYLAMRADIQPADIAEVFALNISPEELEVYSLAHAQSLRIVGLPSVVRPGSLESEQVRVLGRVQDARLNYDARAIYDSDGFLVGDAAELLLLTGEEHRGSGRVPAKQSVILEENRQMILPASSKANNFINIGRSMKLSLVDVDGSPLTIDVSLQSIIGLGEIGPLSLTRQHGQGRFIMTVLAALIYIYDRASAYAVSVNEGDDVVGPNPQFTRVASMVAHQIAVSLHSLFGLYANTQAVRQLGRSLFIEFLKLKQDPMSQASLRAHISAAHMQHQLALSTAALVLTRIGAMPFGMQEDLTRIFETERTVDVAVMSDMWQGALRPR